MEEETPLSYQERLSELEKKWLYGTITPEEQEEYAGWYNQKQDEPVEIPYTYASSAEAHRRKLLKRINAKIDNTGKRKQWYWSAAGLVVFMGGMIAYFLVCVNSDPVTPVVTNTRVETPEIKPGEKKATLTLSNGQTLLLDAAADGLLEKQGNIQILLEDGRLAYKGKEAALSPLFMNTLTTGNGQQYNLVLSDGTRVWLNAASSLHFPASFSGSERRVELTGEAYFEVARSASKPFYIKTNGETIQVLGTHFNVNAYPDEETINTTLVEGRVEINSSVILLPQQQARTRNGKTTVHRNIATEEVTAWKDGRFNFNNAGIGEIMRQLERWYDIKVIFDGPQTTDTFFGTISRSVPLDQVLQILKNSRVHFEIKERTLIVHP